MTNNYIGVFTEEGLDQVCDTIGQARKEQRYLRDAGFTVTLYPSGNNENVLFKIDGLIREGLGVKTAIKRTNG